MPNLQGLEGINNEALKELSLRYPRPSDEVSHYVRPSLFDTVVCACSKCRLQKLEGIDFFERLKRLWARGNSIKKVDIHFASLDLLDLSDNGLFEIPDLSGCPNLQELDLSKNKARGVWAGILSCTKLSKLNLQKNKFKWDQEQFAACLGIMQVLPLIATMT